MFYRNLFLVECLVSRFSGDFLHPMVLVDSRDTSRHYFLLNSGR